MENHFVVFVVLQIFLPAFNQLITKMIYSKVQECKWFQSAVKMLFCFLEMPIWRTATDNVPVNFIQMLFFTVSLSWPGLKKPIVAWLCWKCCSLWDNYELTQAHKTMSVLKLWDTVWDCFKGETGNRSHLHADGTAFRCTAALRLDSDTSAETKRGVKLTGDA